MQLQGCLYFIYVLENERHVNHVRSEVILKSRYVCMYVDYVESVIIVMRLNIFELLEQWLRGYRI